MVPAGHEPRRSWRPMVLAAVAAVVVGVAGGALTAVMTGGAKTTDEATGDTGQRYTEGACLAIADWELVGVEMLVHDDPQALLQGWGVVSAYGMAAGQLDDGFDELYQASQDAYRSFTRLDQDALTEATDRIIAICRDAGYVAADS